MREEDHLEFMREEERKLNKTQDKAEGRVCASCNLSKGDRSELKGESGSFAEDPAANTDEEKQRGSIINSMKVDGSAKNNIKRKYGKKKENSLLKKVLIKNAYTAFTFHDRSSFETSVFEKKSATSELTGLSLDKIKSANSDTEEFKKNIEYSRLTIGDISPKQRLEDTETDEETKRMTKNDTEKKQLPKNKDRSEDFPKAINENYKTEMGGSTINTENNKIDLLKNEPNDSYCEITNTKEREITDEREMEDQISASNNIFSSSKQLFHRFMKWTLDCYERSKNDYDISSPQNYLHSVSKKLTK